MAKRRPTTSQAGERGAENGRESARKKNARKQRVLRLLFQQQGNTLLRKPDY
jgi:hypothetical protein